MPSDHEIAAPRADRPAAALTLTGVRPRKSRGQNFLVQEQIAERIVAAAALAPGTVVLEIGPGLGILSRQIVMHPIARLYLIELDPRLAAALESRFHDDPRVTVMAQDFLHSDLSQIAAGAPITVIGNLPFNIAAAMLERLCAYSARVERMVLMFQREVAERIKALPGMRSYGALSAYTAMYWEIIEHFRVAAGSFHPRPKVDAVVLVFEAADRVFAPNEERAVLATIRASFAAPRKTIRNSLAGGLQVGFAIVEDALMQAGIDSSMRPGTLSVADFTRLSRALSDASDFSDRDA